MQAGAVATKGVLGDACAAGYRERSGMAYGGARVPEVLSALFIRAIDFGSRGRLHTTAFRPSARVANSRQNEPQDEVPDSQGKRIRSRPNSPTPRHALGTLDRSLHFLIDGGLYCDTALRNARV